MSLKLIRSILFLFLSIFSSVLGSQTLYWVGGSGNFNDPSHWSLSSGGPSANRIPDSRTDVLFNDNSGSQKFKVRLAGQIQVNSLKVQLVKEQLEFVGEESSVLTIHDDFILNQRTSSSLKTLLIFSRATGGDSKGFIDFSGLILNCNINFTSGDWILNNIAVSDNRTLNFQSGNYTLNNTNLVTGNLIANIGKVEFHTNTALITAKHNFWIGPNTVFNTQSTGFVVNSENPDEYKVDGAINFGSGAKLIGGGNSVAACGLTLSSQPLTCSGANDGKIFVTIDPSCSGTYTLQFNNPGGCTAIGNTTVTAGGSYTFSGLQGCFGSYQAIIIQGGFPVNVSNFVSVSAPPAIAFFPFFHIQPTCFGLCNGSFRANWSGASNPYTIIHNPPSQPQYTTNNVSPGTYTYNNICAGVHNFTVIDFNNCTYTASTILTQPTALSANTSSTHVTCNTFSNGAFAVSPIGGTANYTIDFSIGGSQTTGALGTVTATSLPAGPVTATITDANGCTLTANALINQPTAFTVTPFSTSVSCNGGNNGTASVQVAGATPNYSYNWAPGGQTTSSLTNLTAGTRTVTITDANSCTTSANFNIAEPPAITLTPTFTNLVCNSATNGAISIAASGGTGAFSFTWVAPPSNTISTGAAASINTLSAGAHTIYASDANLCTSSVVVTLTQPPATTITSISQSITCLGLTNGSATVTIAGGNGGPFTFTWTAPGPVTISNATSVTNLAQGTYTVAASDASACVTSTTAVITQPATSVTPISTQTNLTCNAANAPCNGVITASPTGGIPPYNYTLTILGSTLTSAPPYNNLCAGSYTLNITDASGCPQQTTNVLTQPTPSLSASTATTAISCFGGTTTLTGSASGGNSASYTFTWNSASGSTAAAVITGTAGSYTLTAKDASNCINQATVLVTQPSSISISVNTPSISCFNVCNAVMSTTVSGGSGVYTYTWTNSSNSVVSNAAAPGGMCSGNYTLTVADAALCTRTVPATVLSPSAISLTQTALPVDCSGNSNGSATIQAAGGTPGVPAYTFSIPTATNTTGQFNGLTAGAYVATVLDAAGCTQTIAFNIGTPPPLTATITGNVGSCNLSNGAATVTAAGGNVGAYTYSWVPAGGSSSVASGLAPGNYSVTVSDFKSCNVTVTTNIAFIVNVTVTPIGAGGILCNGTQSGVAVVNHAGGTPPFSYTWAAVGAPTLFTQAVNTLSGSIVYTVTVKDNNNCQNSATLSLVQPPAITIAAVPSPVSCFGFSNGAISTTLSGGTGALSPTWSPGGQLTASIASLTAGSYTINVRDVNLCTSSLVVNITSPSSISVTFTNTNPTGCVSNNGSICATASGGSGAGYTYSLTPPGTSNASGCFNGLGGGAFTLLVTDGTGCSTTSITSLTNPTSPTLAIVTSSIACFGASTGVISTTATGSGPFTFSLNPAAGTITVSSPTLTASSLTTGLYFISATDANSCITTQTVNVNQASSVTINSISVNLSCNNIPTGSISVSPLGGTPGYTFSWVPAASITTGQGTGTVSNLASGGYTLNLTDANSCLTSYNFSLTQPPAITITATTFSLLCNGICNGSITSNAAGGTGAISYSWTAPGGATLTGSGTPTVSNLCANTGTNVNYSLTVTDQNTCSVTSTFTLGEPPAFTSTVTLLNPSCSNSCNAVATHSANGGVPNYTFSWSSSAVNTSTLGGLCANNYTATVTDANGCTSVKPFTVTAPTAFTGTLTPTNPLCNNASNGSITSTLTGAQGTVSYVWSPAGTGPNPSGLSASPVSVYTLVATDQNSCEVTITTTFTNPPAILASISGTNPSCSGNSNGVAAVSVTNAVGALSFTWQPTGPPTQTTQTANGLSSSVVYTVFVTDNNSCTAQQTVSLLDPPTFTVLSTVATTSCGASNGSITLNVSGGTPGVPVAYNYTWSPGSITIPQGQGTATVINLAAGAYSVLVMDGAGCTTVVPVAIANSNGPVLPAVVSSSISCHPGNGPSSNGQASLDPSSISGGTPGYTISWGPSPTYTNTTNPITNLASGFYQVRVIDANGCISFTNVTISQPSSVSVNESSLVPLCNGICDGSIAVTPTGGIAPYTYTWTTGGGGSLPNSPSQSSLCAGSYTMVMGYNGVCTDTTIFNLANQTSLTIVPSTTNNSCFGNTNGAITLTVSGGTPTYNISWSNSQTGLTASNLSNGSYTAVVSDINGCQDTLVSSVTSAPQLSLTTSVTSPSCGFSNGTASATASGGTAPFTYSWSTSAISASVSGLAAGIYVVTVNDNLLCNSSQTVIVNNSNGITGETINVQQIPCFGSCNGAATITPIGGNPPVSISWLTSPPVSGSVVSNLCPGTYFAQMTDAQNCVRSASVTINPVITLTVSPFITPPSCGLNNGSISVSVNGGVAPYLYLWSPGSSTAASSSSLGAGTYTVLVTESSTNNCSTSQVITLSNPGGPVISSTVTPNPCFSNSLASIQTIGTSTSGGIISYNWSNGSVTPGLSNLPSSILTLTVSSTTGTVVCNTIQTYTLTDPPQLLLNQELIHHPTCNGLIPCDGSISVQALGGTTPYTYTWTPAANGPTLGALCEGVYTLNLNDANNCSIGLKAYTLTSRSSISVTANTFSSSCSSVSDGTVTVSASGGLPTYTYTWQGPAGSFTSTSTTYTGVPSGIYSYTVTDSLSCIKTGSFTLAPTLTVVAEAGADTITCPGTGTVVLTGINSSGAQTYNWYKLPGNGLPLSTTADYTVENLSDPTLYLLVVTSSIQACFDADSVFIDIYTTPPVEAGTSTTIPLDATVTIGGNPTGATAVSYTWQPAIYLINSTVPNPVTSNTFNVVFTVTVQDARGCIASDTVRVDILPEIFFTNAFSPNSDGKNDLWIIDYMDQFPGSTVEIYNRWGERLYQSDDYTKEQFDGKFKGKDLPVGTYYYIINLKIPNKDITKQFTGPLTIFR